MLMTMLRISLLVFSMYGGSQLFYERLKVPREFSYLCHICTVVLGLYLAAYIGLLQETVFLFFTLSITYGGYSLVRNIKAKKIAFFKLKVVHIWFVFYCLLIGNVLMQTQLEHYDNFSHWAVIVKFLFTEGSLPTVQDTIISYTSYPMGSSLFVYYAVMIAGFKDSVMLLGQFLLIASAFYAMFAVIRDKSRVLIVTAMIAGIASLNYFNISIRMNNLLVDFLLPVIALAGIAIVIVQRKEPVKMSFMVFLTTSMLSLIKSSGLFFSAIVLIYYIYEIIRLTPLAKNKFKLVGTSVITLVMAFAPIVYWNIYVKANFPVTKHEVDLSAYQSIFDAKDAAVTQDIINKMLYYLADIQNTATQGFILFNLLLLLGFLIIKFGIKRRNSLLKILILGNLIYMIYYAGILLMFLYSMPVDEAVQLAGIERYASSIVIFTLGLAIYALVREVDYSFYEQNIESRSYRSFKSLFTKKLYQYSSIIFAFFAVLMMLSEVNGMKYHNELFEASIPAQFLRASGHGFELSEDAYLVVTTEQENLMNYYTGFVGMYYLYSPNVTVREDFTMNAEEFKDFFNDYDKVVILDEHWTFNAMIEQMTGYILEPGMYEVEEIFQNTENVNTAHIS